MGNDIFGAAQMLRRIDWSKKASVITATIANVCVTLAGVAALKQIDFMPPRRYILLYWAVTEIGVIIIWIFARYIRPVDRRGLSLGFAVSADPESQKFYGEILASFQRQINEANLAEIVHIRKLPNDLHFKTNSQAEKYASTKGLRVLLWGDTTRATADGDALSIFNINVTYSHATPQGLRSGFTDNVGRNVKRIEWKINDTDSLRGLVVVAANVLEISLYTLAVCLLSTNEVRNAESAVKILNNLKVLLGRRIADENFPNLNELRRHVDLLLRNEYEKLSAYYTLDVKNYVAAYECISLGLTLDEANYNLLIGMARTCWELKDRGGARRYTNKARQLYPDEPLPYLNLAFFHLYDGKYGKALAYYKKRLKDRLLAQTNIVEVIEFLEHEYDKTTEPALLFATAWLGYKYADKKRSFELLQQFMALTKNKVEKYKVLRNEAMAILGEYKP